MERYKNLGGNSGVAGYEIGIDYVIVVFKGGKKSYRWSYRKAGQQHVENMKRLAESGQVLNSYIITRVKNLND
jgi:predicted metal-dependent enzyme (double-stranded beta helix superfamily)|tara:strand:+ start:7747 stop:7965 length:219 start_codon:yes stop_codon:yes gene_type:complete